MGKRKILFAITVVFILLSVSLTSCLDSDDGYSLNDNWIGFGVLKADADSSDHFFIKMDGGELLYPISYNSFELNKIEDGDRVLINFTKLGEVENSPEKNEFYIKINSLRKILTKEIHQFSQASADSIGYDPIIVKNAWVANDLINFELQYWGADKKHLINLVNNNEMDGDAIKLHLKHNAHNDEKYLLTNALVSFHIKDLQDENKDSLVFNIFNIDYEEVTHKNTLVYHY